MPQPERRRRPSARNISAWICAAALAVGTACESVPEDADLDRWLSEAQAAEREAQRTHELEDETLAWTLTVLGETRSGAPLLLRNPDIEAASTVTIHAAPPLDGAVVSEFRGARLSDLVQRAGGPMPGVDEVTLLASDGFRATVAWEDLSRAPILLATHRDGIRLRREQGGPLIAAFPLREYPELLERYTESFWVYYVTHLVVGTPAPSLRVGEHHVERDALLALPTRELSVSVGYRVGWPSEPVRLVGPSLREVLRAGNVELAESMRVRVMSLAPISRGSERATHFSWTEVASEEVILGLRYGEDETPIPARLGGPIVLAFSDAVAAAHPGHDWLTFVTDVRVEESTDP